MHSNISIFIERLKITSKKHNHDLIDKHQSGINFYEIINKTAMLITDYLQVDFLSLSMEGY